jgi:hypothetical protein
MKLFVFSLWLVALSQGLAAQGLEPQNSKIYGVAFDKSEKKILYHEVLQVTPGADGMSKIIETKYLDPELKEFGSIKSTFKSNLFVPDSVLVDNRLKRKETLELKGNEATIEVSVKGKPPEVKKIKIDSSFVAGQGFDNFILKNFDTLSKGNEIKVSFIVVRILDYYKFLVSNRGKKNITENEVSFKIELNSFFLNIIADPIIVTYDKKSKKLLEFRGLSNLNNEKGEKQDVVIKYSDSPPIGI